MIRYYAYYNHGGYKDFYLGNQEENVKSKFFLPLLAVHEQSLEENSDNDELRKQVEHQMQLPNLLYSLIPRLNTTIQEKHEY